VSMSAEDMPRNKMFSRFEYHMFYVLYPFVTYLLTLPRNERRNVLKIEQKYFSDKGIGSLNKW
jgi:hypothetical protein